MQDLSPISTSASMRTGVGRDGLLPGAVPDYLGRLTPCKTSPFPWRARLSWRLDRWLNRNISDRSGVMASCSYISG